MNDHEYEAAMADARELERRSNEPSIIDRLVTGFDRYSYSTFALKAIEFVIDGFISNLITVIAGHPGSGKTNLLVVLACVAAGLVKYESGGVKATLRRKVAYVTEDPGQVERILYGLRRQGLITVAEDEVQEWFEIIPARRANPEQLASFIENVCEEKTASLGEAFCNYETRPLVVLDTSNATLDLDDENNNSAAGKAIASAKAALGSGALWLVAHTSKVASREDVALMSARGAGAFEGDANGVAYILSVENQRFLCLGKHRYEAEYTEARFDSHADFETIQTPWGREQKVWYRYGTILPSEAGERERIKTVAKEKAESEAKAELRGRIHAALLDAYRDNQKLNKSELKRIVGGNGGSAGREIEAMIEEGLILAEHGEKNSKVLSIPAPNWSQS